MRGAKKDISAESSPFFLEEKKVSVPGQDDDVAKYIATTNGHRSIDRRLRVTLLLLVIALLLVPLSLLVPQNIVGVGYVDASAAKLVSGTAGRIHAFGEMFSGSVAGRVMEIGLWQSIAVLLAGAALALSGAVYQGTLKNALASPSTLGVMSGGTLGLVIYTLFYALPKQDAAGSLIRASELSAYFGSLSPFEYFVVTQAKALCSLAGCLIIVVLVLLIATIAGRGRVSKVGLVISGQVFSAIITGVIEMVRYYLRDYGTEAQVSALRTIVGGSFDSITGPFDVLLIAVPVGVGIVIIMALRGRLNLLAFDDEEARSMGISTTRTRNAVVIVCTILTAVIVSFCGAVGFVGFLVPHLARKLVGPDFRYYIPASLCLGSAYLLVAHCIMKVFDMFSGSIGTFTSLIGVVCFVVLAIRQRARGNVDWI